ncbi:MAG: exo-alpha-sialidase [Clostridia bacterium]|nr:exo-alpha-sialidase [Clostridia bacterium]
MNNDKIVLRAVYDEKLVKTGYPRHFGEEDAVLINASWNKNAVVLTLTSEKAKSYKIALGGVEKEISGAKGETVCNITTADGLEIFDGNQLFPISVTADGETFCGQLMLCDYDMISITTAESIKELVDSTKVTAAINPEMDPAVTDLGACVIGNGFNIYDRHNKTSPNYPHTNVDMCLCGIDALADRDKNICVDMVLNVKSFPSMDYKTVRNFNASYGLGFFLCAADGNDSIYFGFQRNEGGLYLFVVGGTREIAPLNIPFGVPTSFTLKWGASGDVIVYVNGEKAVSMRIGKQKRPHLAPNSLSVAWKRSRYIPACDEDNLDMDICDLNIYADETLSVSEKFDATDIFEEDTGAPICSTIYKAPSSLIINKPIENEKYGTSVPFSVISSNVELLTKEGKFVAPTDRSRRVEVSITAPTFERQASFIVSKTDIVPQNTLVSLDDKDPFVGKGEPSSALIDLSSDFASVIYDMGKQTEVNRVVLRSVLGSVGVINKNNFALFTSIDNESYEYVKNFSILTKGDTVYFYNFNANTRYVKIHTTTNGLGDIGKVVGYSEEMLEAFHSDAPLLAEGSFEKTTTFTVENTENKAVCDKIVRLTLADMGICECDLKSDKADIRFLAKGAYLPHYFDGTKFYVRVLELAPSEKLTVTVLYKNENALSVSDGHEALEIQYGMKHGRRNNETGWFNSVATMPNGDLLRIVDIPAPEGKRQLAMYRSTNCGLTWSPYEIIPNTDMITQCGGFIVDKKNNKVFFFAYDFNIFINGKWTHGIEGRYCKYYIFLSEDNGYTWSFVGNPENAPTYAISYSNGITLKDEDGEGPNVDYVFTTGIMVNLDTMAFSTGGMYSKDGGKTWIFSDTVANFTDGNNDFAEGGLSEETVWEKEDGTLVFYARCQLDTCVHFAKSYSYDHGVTWSDITSESFSNIYTSNTQPIIEKLDEKPVFMWGGNNSLGGNTYLRYPLNLARSYDDGENFEDIVDVSLRTNVATLNRDNGASLHTNPDLTFGKYRGVDAAYIVSSVHQLYVLDAKAHIEKTKGAYDSFESGAEAEGWYAAQVGTLLTTDMGATDGGRALLLKNFTAISRPLHYIREGEISFDLYASEFGEGLGIELQSAFNDREDKSVSVSKPQILFYAPDKKNDKPETVASKSTVMHFNVDTNGNILDCGKKTGLKLEKGNNKVSILFNGKNGTAYLTVNGNTAQVEFAGNDGYISYFTVFPKKESTFSLDSFIAIKDN